MNKSLKIVTFNLRFTWDGDGTNSFFSRSGLILDKIANENPDIICFQEGVEKNMGFLKKHLKPDYTVIFNQRREGLTDEGLAVAFKNNRISLYGLDVFWLSETPYTVASRFEGQSMHPRICQNLLFKDELTGKIFKIYNLHLEEANEDVRLLQMKVVFQHIQEDFERTALPFFIMGDLNTEPYGKVMNYCRENAPFNLYDLTKDIPESFHNFGRLNPGIKIDYIITNESFITRPHSIRRWTDCLNGIYLSDHYPIELNIEL